MEKILPGVAMELKLSREWTYKELYLAILEATAKICRIPKYRVYTVEELREEVKNRLFKMDAEKIEELPVLCGFLHDFLYEPIRNTRRNEKLNLKGRDFLTLKDYTADEIAYLLELAAQLKEKKKKGILVDTLRKKCCFDF